MLQGALSVAKWIATHPESWPQQRPERPGENVFYRGNTAHQAELLKNEADVPADFAQLFPRSSVDVGI
jgi:hypothetical protein